eukprot:12016068-Prorocentrum_lima.AAC.1
MKRCRNASNAQPHGGECTSSRWPNPAAHAKRCYPAPQRSATRRSRHPPKRKRAHGVTWRRIQCMRSIARTATTSSAR